MIPSEILKRLPEININEWKRLGNRGTNSVLNRDLYYIGFTREHIKEMLDIDSGSTNALFIEPALFLHKQDFNNFRNKFMERVKQDNTFIKLVIDRYAIYVKQLEKFSNLVPHYDFKNMDIKTLQLLFNECMEMYLQIMPFSYLSINEEEIADELMKFYGVSNLNFPNRKTPFMKEKEELLEIAGDFNGTLTEEIKEKIIQHLKKYPWLNSTYFHVNEVTFEETLERIKNIPKQKENKKIESYHFLNELLYLKTYRKEAISIFSYAIKSLFDEMAQRMGLEHKHIINMTLDEINSFFTNGTKPDKEELDKRTKGFAYVVINGKKHIISNIKFKEEPLDENEVKGNTGCRGYAKGKALLIKDNDDIKKLTKDKIIVANSIRPDYIKYLTDIKGIIADYGGVLSHAVVLAREIGIPCLIGTKNATQIFKDGDEVELDADKGIARKIKQKKFRKMFGITMGLCRADLYMPTHVFNTDDVIGRGHDDIIFKIKDGKNTGYFSEEVIKYMGEHGLNVLNSKSFVERNQEEVEEAGINLWAYSEYLASLPLKYMQVEELLNYYNALFESIQKMFGFFNVSQPCISFAIENEIAKKMEILGLDSDAKYEIMEEMLKQDKTTMIEEEEKDLIKIALKIKANKELLHIFEQPMNKIIDKLHHLNNNPFFNEIVQHENKYSFLASSENFDEFDRRYFIERLKELVKKPDKELEEEIVKKTPDKTELETLRHNIIKTYSLPPDLVYLLDVSRIYSHQRMLIRIYWTKAINVWGKFLREFARRMDISEVDVQYVLRDEINNWLKHNIKIDYAELKKRRELAVFGIFGRGKPFLLTGEDASNFEKQYLNEEISKESVLRGTIASRGFKRGKVKVLNYGKNMIKQIEEMEHGDILVTGNTRPDMILALKKASAVVTNEGGICSHAALVAREFGIPCIVGTKDATEMFKDGDIVEVDANKGIVKKIS